MTDLQLLCLPEAKKHTHITTLEHLPGSSSAFAVAQLAVSRKHQSPVLCITPDTPTALQLEREVRFLLAQTSLPTLLFPDWETLPYDHFSPHQDIISQRLETLYQLPHLNHGVIIVPVATMMQRVTPVEYLLKNSLLVKNKQALQLDQLKHNLAQVGYKSVTQVMEHGEFAARGSLLDIYPMGSDTPFRLDFFDDEIDSIRCFDPETQRSLEPLTEIRCLPAREFPTDQAGIEIFRQQYRQHFQRTGSKESIYAQISQGLLFPGVEYYLPLFFTHVASLFDYLYPKTCCVRVHDISEAASQIWTSVQTRYQERAHDIERPILKPEQLFLPPHDLFSQLKNFTQYHIPNTENTPRDSIQVQALPDLSAEYQKTKPLQKLQQWLAENKDSKVLFTVPSAGRREILLEMLNHIDLKPKTCDCIEDFLNTSQTFSIVISPIAHGFILSKRSLIIITENDLLGQRVAQRALRERKNEQNPETIIRNLAELSIGQAVTHIDHGIALYQGLDKIEAAGVPCEYLKLEYLNQSVLYVPVTSLHKISRYSGSENIILSKLGSDKWHNAKRKAAEKIRDVAAELLSLYAKREVKQGFACEVDTPLYQQFSGEFPFEETPDQTQAIAATLADMQAPKCMDRLVCGDVGFGKTEVAMRAAFVAVQSKRQVALLVPTTLLAQQHYESFRDRFANWPVRIGLLSRFKTSKESKQVTEQLQSGQVDIVIGTHKLLGNDIKFHDLGLLIIDEEHRFGVKQKEKIKALRAQVDILALTATPIPRTLNMSMHGMRDLSIIATPPAKRLSIKTFIHVHQDSLITEAVLRELKRGGQVYYLHNEVSSIAQCQAHLQQLIPQAQVRVAHGQMRERELEQVMSDFYHQRFQVLVCTTIIETGIDVPNANTIIMDRADKFGLAQLHQLRGRVGRSHHQAYAYLLTPSPKAMSSDAKKRLEAIRDLETLGSGFTLATHDLEIRGTGELLGEEQSGQMETIGFSLYMDMLRQAVNDLKSGKTVSLEQLEKPQTDIELRIPALLPEEYMPNVNMRLSFYKRLANMSDEDDIIALKIELIDRFGRLPEATQFLLAVTKLRLLAEKIGIKRIDAHARGGQFEFHTSTPLDPKQLIQLVTQTPEKYSMDSAVKFVFRAAMATPQERLSEVESLLVALSTSPTSTEKAAHSIVS